MVTADQRHGDPEDRAAALRVRSHRVARGDEHEDHGEQVRRPERHDLSEDPDTEHQRQREEGAACGDSRSESPIEEHDHGVEPAAGPRRRRAWPARPPQHDQGRATSSRSSVRQSRSLSAARPVRGIGLIGRPAPRPAARRSRGGRRRRAVGLHAAAVEAAPARAARRDTSAGGAGRPVVADAELELARAVADRQRGRRRHLRRPPRSSGLLDHAVGRQVDAGGQGARLALHAEVDLEAPTRASARAAPRGGRGPAAGRGRPPRRRAAARRAGGASRPERRGRSPRSGKLPRRAAVSPGGEHPRHGPRLDDHRADPVGHHAPAAPRRSGRARGRRRAARAPRGRPPAGAAFTRSSRLEQHPAAHGAAGEHGQVDESTST